MAKEYKMPKLKYFLEKKNHVKKQPEPIILIIKGISNPFNNRTRYYAEYDNKMYDKSDPVWSYLEREMRENIEFKPYNEKVGSWLKFLKGYKYYLHREAEMQYQQLKDCAGPYWFYELSSYQKRVLNGLKTSIHQDLIEGLPVRTKRSLDDLGVTAKIPNKVLMKAMNNCIEDPGLFIWNLYTALYKSSPSVLRSEYDMDAMILISCLVFIDMDECIETLEKLTKSYDIPSPPKLKKKKKEFTPSVRYGEYLQKFEVTCFERKKTREPKPESIGCKIKLRSEESYERLCKDNSFLNKRTERNQKTKIVERVCKYKFWEPPSTLRNTDPKMAAIAEAMKTFKMKARPRHKSQFKNSQFHIGGIGFCKGAPYFIINSVSILPTGYIPINGGIVTVLGKDNVTNILGYWKYPKDVNERCIDTCDCLKKWECTIMDYIKDSKCKCGHLYDFHNEGKLKEKYFYPPTKHGPYFLDQAKVFQLDPTEDFIKESVQNALRSVSVTPAPSRPTVSAAALKTKELTAALMADLSDTPLMIPHLPQANLLNNIQAWVRKRVQGKLTPKQHKSLLYHSSRKYEDLRRIRDKFHAIAYRIPFTNKQLDNMNWSHRKLIQKLFKILLEDFVTRNRLKLVEQSRLLWATMKNDSYPSEAFLDTFFTYMPGRLKDTFVINPYSSELTPKFGAKTCPLNLN